MVRRETETLKVAIRGSRAEGSSRMIGVKQVPSRVGPDFVAGLDSRVGYALTAANDARECDAKAWAEGTIADVADEPRRDA